MSNPIFIDCPEGAWTKIATAVITGFVHRKNHIPKYLQTYKQTGEAAPTLLSDGVGLFLEFNTEEITDSNPIDVYIWCTGAAGRVRVDL